LIGVRGCQLKYRIDGHTAQASLVEHQLSSQLHTLDGQAPLATLARCFVSLGALSLQRAAARAHLAHAAHTAFSRAADQSSAQVRWKRSLTSLSSIGSWGCFSMLPGTWCSSTLVRIEPEMVWMQCGFEVLST
jgi:hypothetical protein